MAITTDLWTLIQKPTSFNKDLPTFLFPARKTPRMSTREASHWPS